MVISHSSHWWAPTCECALFQLPTPRECCFVFLHDGFLPKGQKVTVSRQSNPSHQQWDLLIPKMHSLFAIDAIICFLCIFAASSVGLLIVGGGGKQHINTPLTLTHPTISDGNMTMSSQNLWPSKQLLQKVLVVQAEDWMFVIFFCLKGNREWLQRDPVPSKSIISALMVSDSYFTHIQAMSTSMISFINLRYVSINTYFQSYFTAALLSPHLLIQWVQIQRFASVPRLPKLLPGNMLLTAMRQCCQLSRESYKLPIKDLLQIFRLLFCLEFLCI